MNASAWRAGLRLARRELQRTPARTALVLLLIVLPTAAMATVTTLFRTSEVTRAAARADTLGRADLYATFSRGGRPGTATDGDVARLRAALPASARILIDHDAPDRVRGPGYALTLFISDLDLSSPLAPAQYTKLTGRAPKDATEAVVTRRVAHALRLSLGSSFTPERIGRTLRVVGIADERAAPGVVVTGGLPPGASTEVFIAGTTVAPKVAGWDFPTNIYAGYAVNAQVAWTDAAGALGLVVMGTIVAAAFALGARRQLRTIGLLSSAGASPGQVRTSLLCQGLLVGFVGSLAGVAVGTAVVHSLTVSTLQSVTLRYVNRPVTRLTDLAPIVVLGTIAAVGAAAFPAFSAARIPTLQALASHRPTRPKPKTRWILALAVLVGGFALLAVPAHEWSNRVTHSGHTVMTTTGAVAGAAGVLAVMVALLMAAPLAIDVIERATRARGVSWRLAARGIARSGLRSCAIVGAMCVLLASVAGVTTLAKSWTWPTEGGVLSGLPFANDHQVEISSTRTAIPTEAEMASGSFDLGGAEPIPDEYMGRVEEALPSATRIVFHNLVDKDNFTASFGFLGDNHADFGRYGSTPTSVLATRRILDFFAVPQATRNALRHGGAVLLLPTQPVTSHRYVGSDRPRLRLVAVLKRKSVTWATPRILISEATAKHNGWHEAPNGPTLFTTPKPLTAADYRRLELIRSDLQFSQQPQPASFHSGTVSHQVALDVGGNFPSSFGLGFPRPVTIGLRYRWISYATLVVLILGVVGGGLTLSSRDSEDERAVMDAVGASPRTRRRIATRQAALLVAAACVLGLPVGMAAVAAMLAASSVNSTHFRVDAGSLLALAIALPAIAVAATAAVGWLRESVRPPIADVLVFAD